MKRDFTQGFKLIDGSTIPDVTLKTVALTALQGVYEDEKNLQATDKIARFTLATRVYQASVCDLTAEEVALLKTLINKAYPAPLIVAQAWAMLDSDFAEVTA